MAGQAVFPARVVPGLFDDIAGRRLDGNGFGLLRVQQVSVAVVRPPLVDDAVHAALAVAHQEPRFQAARRRRDCPNRPAARRSSRKRCPPGSAIRRRRKPDLAFRNGDPPGLVRAIGPESDGEIVRKKPGTRDQLRGVGEGAGLGEQRGHLAGRERRHPQVRAWQRSACRSACGPESAGRSARAAWNPARHRAIRARASIRIAHKRMPLLYRPQQRAGPPMHQPAR